MPQWNPEVSQ